MLAISLNEIKFEKSISACLSVENILKSTDFKVK